MYVSVYYINYQYVGPNDMQLLKIVSIKKTKINKIKIIHGESRFAFLNVLLYALAPFILLY